LFPPRTQSFPTAGLPCAGPEFALWLSHIPVSQFRAQTTQSKPYPALRPAHLFGACPIGRTPLFSPLVFSPPLLDVHSTKAFYTRCSSLIWIITHAPSPREILGAVSQKSPKVLHHENMHTNDHLRGRHVVTRLSRVISGDICLTKPSQTSHSTKDMIQRSFALFVGKRLDQIAQIR